MYKPFHLNNPCQSLIFVLYLPKSGWSLLEKFDKNWGHLLGYYDGVECVLQKFSLF